MASNPAIALTVEPPKPLDIAGAFQKAAALRSMANKNTIQKQAIEQNAQALRDQELARKDNELVRKAWAESGGNDEDFLKRIKTSGVSPETVLRHETAYANKIKAFGALDEQTQKNKQTTWNILRARVKPILAEWDKNKDDAKAADAMNSVFNIARDQGVIDEDEMKRYQGIMDKGWNRQDAQMLYNSWISDLNMAEEVVKPVEVQPGNTLVDPKTGQPIFTAPPKVTEPTGDYREFKETYYPGWLESKGKTKSATNEMLAYQDFVKEKRTSKLLTPEEEAQEIRIRQASKSPEKTSEDEDYEYWKTLTRDANRQLAEENKQRISEGGKPANEPSGSEIARLRNTPEGPGTRRWGGGQKMPKWLAEQYFEQANGNKDEAKRMALTDGWDIRK